MGSSSFSVRVEGLAEAAQIPGWIDRAQRELLEESAEEIAEAIGEASGSSRVRASWRGRAISSTAAIVESRGTEFAKALDRGAYITPKSGAVLRFSDGSFRPFARLKAKNYVKKGLRKRRRIVQGKFEKAFGDLKGGG